MFLTDLCMFICSCVQDSFPGISVLGGVYYSVIACLWNTSVLLRTSTPRARQEQPDLPGIAGIQLARSLQKNSPLGGNASGLSRDPTQI